MNSILEKFYCLADGHKHKNRVDEAFCSAKFQISKLTTDYAALEAERDRLRELLQKVLNGAFMIKEMRQEIEAEIGRE